MAIVECSYYSQALLGMTKMTVYLPTPSSTDWQEGKAKEHPFYLGKRFPVYYLLHGMCEDSSTILRKTRIESYAQKAGIAVVMPEGENSFYLNPVWGRPYETLIAEELPLFIRDTFPVSDRREETWIGGFSMGGYGALRLALKYSETFGKVTAYSGCYDIGALAALTGKRGEGYFPVQPEAFAGADLKELRGTDADIYRLAEVLTETELPRPEIFLSCGMDDSLYPMHEKTQDVFSELGISYTAQEAEGGHDWDYWDPALREGISWLIGTED